MIALSAVLSLVAVCLLMRDIGRQIDRRTRSVTAAPELFFSASYGAYVLLPALVIFASETFTSPLITFHRFENVNAMACTAVFYIIVSMVLALPIASIPRGRRVFVNSSSLWLMAAVVYAGLAGLLSIIVYRLTGASLTAIALRSLAAFDVGVIFDAYNDARYDMTKRLFIEYGVYGIGTMTTMTALAGVFMVAAVAMYRTSQRRPLRGWFFGLALIASLGFALNTGARSAVLAWGVELMIVVMVLRGKVSLRHIVISASALFMLILAYTLITPKASVGEGSLAMAQVRRFAGNALNDAVVIDEMPNSGATVLRSVAANGMDGMRFEPVDAVVSEYLYGRSGVRWYETPTSIGFYYYVAGWLGVVLGAVVTGIVLIVFRWFVGLSEDVFVEMGLRIVTCMFAWTAPTTGILTYRVPIAGLVMVGIYLACRKVGRGHIAQYGGKGGQVDGVSTALAHKRRPRDFERRIRK